MKPLTELQKAYRREYMRLYQRRRRGSTRVNGQALTGYASAKRRRFAAILAAVGK